MLSLSCIFCSISWAEARLVGSDVHSSSISLKLTDSAYESATARQQSCEMIVRLECLSKNSLSEEFVLEKNLR